MKEISYSILILITAWIRQHAIYCVALRAFCQCAHQTETNKEKKNTNIQKLYRIRNFDLTWIYFEIATQNNSYLAFIHVIFLIIVTMSYRYNR